MKRLPILFLVLLLAAPVFAQQAVELPVLILPNDGSLSVWNEGNRTIHPIFGCEDVLCIPTVSPTGEWIAMTTRTFTDNVVSFFIRLWNPRSRQFTLIAESDEGVTYSYLVWSPDGDELAWLARDEAGEDTFNLYYLADGTMETMALPIELPEAIGVLWGSGNPITYYHEGGHPWLLLNSENGGWEQKPLDTFQYARCCWLATDPNGEEYIVGEFGGFYLFNLQSERAYLWSDMVQLYSVLAPENALNVGTIRDENGYAEWWLHLPNGNREFSGFTAWYPLEEPQEGAVALSPTGDTVVFGPQHADQRHPDYSGSAAYLWHNTEVLQIPGTAQSSGSGPAVWWAPTAYRIDGIPTIDVNTD